MRKITIKEVAEKAEVSTATVSRVLNDNYPVKEEVKERVLQVVKELNYSPNAIARSLKNNKTNLIGFVVGDISNSYFMKIAKVIEDEMRPKGYNLILAATHEDPELELKLLKVLNEKRVDAVVIASTGENGDYIKGLIDSGINVIAVDRKIQNLNIDTVIEDNFSASYDITDLLIKNGHKKIAVVNGRLNVTTGIERFNGFKKALSHNNITLSEKCILKGNFIREDAYEVVKKLFCDHREDLPTAIFAANNSMAEGTMIALEEDGYKIPEDVSLVSYGDLSIPDLVEPRLTVVKQDAYAIGRRVCNILIEKIEEKVNRKDFKEYIVCPKICIGNSVKKL